MRRQRLQRAILSTSATAILAIVGTVTVASRGTAEDTKPQVLDTRPSFEDAVAGDAPTSPPVERIFGEPAALPGPCLYCDGRITEAGAALDGWLENAEPTESLFVPIVPPANLHKPELALPTPWWTQLPAPTVRSAKALFAIEPVDAGRASPCTSLLDTSVKCTSAELTASCKESCKDKSPCSCSEAECEGSDCSDASCKVATCGKAKCTADACASAACTGSECGSSECDEAAVADDPSTDRSVIEIIKIVDALGDSVVCGTVFDDATCGSANSCPADGACTRNRRCPASDEPCPNARTALISALRDLAAADAGRCDSSATASDSKADACCDTGVSACPLAARQPVSVLTVQTPSTAPAYVPASDEAPVCVMTQRQAASRIDATADTLEVDGLYEAADMLRQIADDVRLKARKQAAAAPMTQPTAVTPYVPLYPAAPPAVSAPPVGPAAPDAFAPPPGQWGRPVFEAYRRGLWQPPGPKGLE